jgi:predicted naringenin-chalcone synthase
LSKIVSIATAVPAFCHRQDDLFEFAGKVYCPTAEENRKLKFLYRHSGIDERYSVIPDYSNVGMNAEKRFFPDNATLEPFPTIEQRMKWYQEEAVALSKNAIQKCIDGYITPKDITHLITVSCTGMSAPGLDLQLMESMKLPETIMRTSVNFMGCYAAVHALKIADAFCKADPKANVLVVCTELCTLHFQKEPTIDNITSSLLFGDGAAAVLIQGKNATADGISIDNFYSSVSFKGKKEMAWEISSTGFLMTLTGYVPDLIKEDFAQLVIAALNASGKKQNEVTHWCIHPGGKKILETIAKSLNLENEDLKHAYNVLRQYGNMSSPTILFVLKEMLNECRINKPEQAVLFGAAFGPGLTMETFTASYA